MAALVSKAATKGNTEMHDGMMEGWMGMMLAMGLFGLLFFSILILSIAALVKFLFGDRKNATHEENSNA